MDEPNEDDRPALEIADRGPGADEQLAARDRARLVWQAVLALPEKQRAAVLLHKYQDMDYAEIARVLDCSESALKSLLFRAYETLRMQLASLVATRGPARAGEGGLP